MRFNSLWLLPQTRGAKGSAQVCVSSQMAALWAAFLQILGKCQRMERACLSNVSTLVFRIAFSQASKFMAVRPSISPKQIIITCTFRF